MGLSRSEARARWRRLAMAGFAAGLLLPAVIAVLFQDRISIFLMNPRTPFDTTPPPPPPSYADKAAWIAWPDVTDRDDSPSPPQETPPGADVFYIHSTTFDRRTHWNAPPDDAWAEKLTATVAAPNEAGPFADLGRLFAPRYRQATLFAFFTNKYDGVMARRTAYDDVAAAFEAFLAASDDPERPIVLVGYDQGALHAAGLLQQRFAHDDVLKRRLAAAYLIGHATAPEALAASGVAPCEGAEAIRCAVAYVDLEARFDDEMSRKRHRSLTWNAEGDLVATAGDTPVCVNPLTFSTSEAYASPEAHIGAASATGLRLGETPPAIARSVGARCVRGILVVDRPKPEFLRRRGAFGAKWRPQHFNLFYHDLAADAERRVGLSAARLAEEARTLAPIDDAVDIVDSPINRPRE